MFKKVLCIRSIACLTVLFGFLFVQYPLNAQATAEEIEIKPPAQEVFVKRDKLASPWRDSGCHRYAMDFREPGCKVVTGDAWKKANIMTLYDLDGSIWHRFELSNNYTRRFLENQKKGFKPFSVPYRTASIVLLRLVGESQSWNKVEVNEDTQEIMYIRKDDPMWSMTDWGYWIFESLNVDAGGTQELRNEPAGNVIEENKGIFVNKVSPLRVDGDWVLVQESDRRGWIRWRDGRKILVGCLLNDRKSPAQEPGLK